MTQEKSFVVMGVDPGTRITGYGIIQDAISFTKPIDFGCIRPPASLSLEKRYLIIFESLETLVTTYTPHAIAVESQFVKKNVQSAIKLGMAKGMVLLVAAKYKIPVFEYTPRKAKLAVVGTGSASKFQVQKMVQRILELPKAPEPEDAADALALALCHMHEKNFQERLTHV